MPLSVVDIYRDLLPKTNCRECGYPTCLAFAGMVVSEKLPLVKCPYIAPEKLMPAQKELEQQYAEGKWTRKDPAEDALMWAKERAASMAVADLPGRIGGRLTLLDGEQVLELPYFSDTLIVRPGSIERSDGQKLSRWEQVFLYNHLAQGGSRLPTGKWKGLVELPNTVSKIKSMKAHVEDPLIQRFSGKFQELYAAGKSMGATDPPETGEQADVRLLFQPLPRIPVLLLFWDADTQEGYDAQAKLLFDETIIEHLDIESILFLSERIRQILCGE